MNEEDARDKKEAKLREAVERKAEKRRLSDEKKQLRAEVRQKKKDDAAQKKADDLEKFGREVAMEALGGHLVKFFEKGYVKVQIGSDFEKLLGIEGSADSLQKKSAAGRAVGAVFTMGANVALGSNKRGDLLVTITTDKKVHTLHQTAPYEHDLKAYHRIVSVGKSLIAQNRSEPAAPVASEANSLGDELEKLASLKSAGVLTEEEFITTKGRLLNP